MIEILFFSFGTRQPEHKRATTTARLALKAVKCSWLAACRRGSPSTCMTQELTCQGSCLAKQEIKYLHKNKE